MGWINSLKSMGDKKYWTKANVVEFFAFLIKSVIIIPGLLFDMQFWWLYIFALFSSIAIIWSSTVKTIPTLIWFNILWIFLSLFYIIKTIIN